MATTPTTSSTAALVQAITFGWSAVSWNLPNSEPQTSAAAARAAATKPIVRLRLREALIWADPSSTPLIQGSDTGQPGRRMPLTSPERQVA